MLLELHGMGVLAGRIAVNGTDGGGCGEGAGEAELGWPIGKLRPTRALREVGIGRGGFAWITGLITDELNADRNARRVRESG